MSAEGADRRTITLAGLRAFVAVVEAGGFSAAAARLGLTQPSVSAQLANLEEACGVRLLHRRGKLQLTEEGQDLLRRSRLVLARMEEFERMVSDIRGLRRGRLVVGISTPVQAMPLLARFTAAHPAVELATRLGNTERLLADLADCRVDVAVLTLAGGASLPGHVTSVLLRRQRLGLCMAAVDPWTARAEIGFGELAGQTIIRREAGSMTRALFEDGAREAGAAWEPGIEAGTQEALREAAAAGLGRGMLLEGELVADPRLAFRPLARPERYGDTQVVALSDLMAAPAIRAFMDLVVPAQPCG